MCNKIIYKSRTSKLVKHNLKLEPLLTFGKLDMAVAKELIRLRDDILRAQAHRSKMSYKLIGVWALLLSLTEEYANYCMLVKEVKILPGDIIVEMETGRYIARVNVINVHWL